MADIDLNLLTALDALLAEGTVAGAALGPQCVGDEPDPRDFERRRQTRCSCAGRGMVPTPHATEPRERVRNLTQDTEAVLRPAVASLDLAALKRSFTIRSIEGFVEVFATQLVAAVTGAAPNVRLQYRASPCLKRGIADGSRLATDPPDAVTEREVAEWGA